MEEYENKETEYKDEGDFSIVEQLRRDVEVEKTYIPEGFESVEAFLKDMRETYNADIEADLENRREAVDDKRFAAGEQWEQWVLEHRKGLPNLVINTIPQFTAQLVGDWREDRRAIKVLPSEDGDADVASVRGDLIRSIEMHSRANRIYDSAFESTVTCGDGAFRVSVEYAHDDVFDQNIRLRPIEDSLSAVWDRLSVDPTGRDAKHVFVDDSIPRKEFNRKWKDKDPSTLSQNQMHQMRSSGWCDDQTVKVTEYWRMIERKKLLAMFENGKIREITEENADQLIEQFGMPVKVRNAPCLYAQMHLVTGWAILGGPYEYRLNRLPIIRMTGRIQNIEGRRIRYGIVRFMKDAARLRNFWRSVAAEQLGYAPKAQWIAPESAVEGREDIFRKAHLSRDPLIIYNDDAIAPPERLDPPAPQMALLNEAQVNTQDMKDVTGIHDASLGIRSNEVSGKAINARQREGDIASLTYYDNGNESILEAGDVINQLISQVYDGTRVIRTIGEDESIKFMNINDPMDPASPDLSVGRYDVALGTGTSYSTRRAEAADAMMQAVQVWPQLLEVAGDIVAKAQDWPGADDLAERLKKTIPTTLLTEEEIQDGAGSGLPQEVQEQMSQMQEELQKLKFENQELKLDRTIDRLKIQVDAYNGETQRIRALSDHEVDNTKLNQEGIKQILEQARFERDMASKSSSNPDQS